MHINKGYPAGISPLQPHGTNSTFFTECCNVAICDDEKYCPNCKREVIGAKAETPHERNKIRWRYATSHWKR